MEAPLAQMGPGLSNQHITAFSRTEVCPPRDVSNRHTDVLEVSWAGATDTVKSSYGHLVKDPLVHWQPMKHITKNWGDVLKLASTDDQTGRQLGNDIAKYKGLLKLFKNFMNFSPQMAQNWTVVLATFSMLFCRQSIAHAVSSINLAPHGESK